MISPALGRGRAPATLRRSWLSAVPYGLLYNRDGRLATPLLDLLASDAGLTVGDQLPYAVDDEHDCTLPVHGEQRGCGIVGVEIRQDLIAESAGQEQWMERIGALLRQLRERLPRGLSG